MSGVLSCLSLGTSQAALGTNPISLAVPAGEDSFVLDMATTTAALGKVSVCV